MVDGNWTKRNIDNRLGMAGVWNLFRIYRKAGSGWREASFLPSRYHALLLGTYCRSLIDSRQRQQGRSNFLVFLFFRDVQMVIIGGKGFCYFVLSRGIYGETTIWGIFDVGFDICDGLVWGICFLSYIWSVLFRGKTVSGGSKNKITNGLSGISGMNYDGLELIWIDMEWNKKSHFNGYRRVCFFVL